MLNVLYYTEKYATKWTYEIIVMSKAITWRKLETSLITK